MSIMEQEKEHKWDEESADYYTSFQGNDKTGLMVPADANDAGKVVNDVFDGDKEKSKLEITNETF